MNYLLLTNNQKELARTIVREVRANNIAENFGLLSSPYGELRIWRMQSTVDGTEVTRNVLAIREDPFITIKGAMGNLLALVNSNLVLDHGDDGYTLTGLIYRAVDSDFKDDEKTAPISTLAQPHPPEIAMSLDRLRTKYPDPKTLGFLVMRFEAAKPFQRIVEIIKRTAEQYGVTVVRADENEFHADLFGNVRTHLHGCGFGIAVYEHIKTEEPNANVGLEVGYLMAMNKPVLLLKDKTVPALQSDLAGKLYKPFDPHDPEGTIPIQLVKWLEDNGIAVPPRGSTP